jgi:hypothetical protein
MLIFLATLLATLPSILRSRAVLELENLALRHQIGVLQRSARKRPKLILVDLWYAKIPSGSHLAETLALICRLPCARKTQEASPTRQETLRSWADRMSS